MSPRLLLFGDLHAGKGRALYPERLDEQSAVLDRILTLGREHEVDVILGLGDTFDRRRPDVPEMLAVERPLVAHRDADGPPVHVLIGNHECSGVDEVTPLDVLEEAGLLVAHRGPEVFGVAGVGIACLPWTPVSRLVAAQGGGDRDSIYADAADLLLATAARLRDDGAEILCGHWSVSGASLPSGLPVDQLREVILPRDDLERLGFDALIFAHIHKAGRFGDRSLYVGSPLPLDHSEANDDHGCWIFDTELMGTGVVQPEFVPLESRRFVTVSITDSLYPPDVDGAIVRVKDTIAAGETFDAREIRETFLAHGAHVVTTRDVVIERAARPDREPVLDTDREPVELLAAWLAQTDLTDSDVHADELIELARTYLAGDRAVVA